MHKLNLSTVFMVFMLILVGLLAVYPLGMVFFGSFSTAGPGKPGTISLQAFREVFTDPTIAGAFWTTLWLGVVRTAITLGLGIFICWVIVRTDTPFRTGLEYLFWINFFLPLLPMTLGWILLLDPSYGLINQLLMKLPFIHRPLFDIYSYGGIIWTHIGFSTSLKVLMFAPAFRNIDSSYEESALMCGAGRFGTLARITLPMLLPAILGTALILFVRSLESFEIEFLLGVPAKIFVYTTKVHDMTKWEPPDYAGAAALSTVFMVVVFVVVFISRRIIGRRQYTTVSGRGYTGRPMPLGWWKYFTLGVCFMYLAIFLFLPFVFLVVGTFMKFQGMFFLPEPYTLKNWTEILTDPAFVASFKNSLLLGFGVALLGICLYTSMSYIVTRTALKGRQALDFMSWLPWAVPGMLLGLGILWAVLAGIPFLVPLYGSLALLTIAIIIKDMPLGVRMMNGTMVQISKELEESSRMAGATWLQTFRRILTPLLSPAILGIGIIIFLSALRDISTIILIYSNKSKVLSILMLEAATGGNRGKAAVVGLIITAIVLVVALIGRKFGLSLGPKG